MPGSADPDGTTLWVVISNVAFVIPSVLAFRARNWLCAFGFFALLCVSSIYHYAHDTEHQGNREAWYNGFRENDTWQLSKADTVLSVWAAAAAALQFAPHTRVDFWVHTGISLFSLFGAMAVVTWGGYNKCAKGIQSCSSDYLGVWYLCVVGGALLLALAWAAYKRRDPWAIWNAHKKAWGTRRLAAVVLAVIMLLTVAALLYVQWTERSLHGVWHFCCAALLSLAMVWSGPNAALLVRASYVQDSDGMCDECAARYGGSSVPTVGQSDPRV